MVISFINFLLLLPSEAFKAFHAIKSFSLPDDCDLNLVIIRIHIDIPEMKSEIKALRLTDPIVKWVSVSTIPLLICLITLPQNPYLNEIYNLSNLFYVSIRAMLYKNLEHHSAILASLPN